MYVLCGETQYCVADRHRLDREGWEDEEEEEGKLRSDPTAADETLGQEVSVSPLSYSVLEPGQY